MIGGEGWVENARTSMRGAASRKLFSVNLQLRLSRIVLLMYFHGIMRGKYMGLFGIQKKRYYRGGTYLQ
jgi:hypothetical protein